jgi:glycosyltransferase involved in cell wall biosynthesis
MHAPETAARLRLGVLASHPIQYQSPIFRELASRCELRVFYAHRQPPQGQADAGFGVAFEWDVDLLSGFEHRFLLNRARHPGTDRFMGCDTPEIADAIAHGGFDAFLVMGWNLKSYWQAVRACRRAGVPVMVRGDSQLLTPRSPARQWAKRMIYPVALRRFDRLLYVGQRNRDYLLHYGVPAQRLHFSPHCVDNDRFAQAAGDRSMARDKWGLDPHLPVVLFSGRLVDSKRPFDLVLALQRLHERGVSVQALFAGDGPLGPALRQACERAGVPARFAGFVNQSALPEAYAAADVLVLPSSGAETWGLVVNEAMACGVPAVVSDAVGCGPDLVVPDVTGATYPVGDADAMAGAVARVLNSPLDHAGIRSHLERYSPASAARGILEAACAAAQGAHA